eukprot:3813938-Amphidinium_carterae.1
MAHWLLRMSGCCGRISLRKLNRASLPRLATARRLDQQAHQVSIIALSWLAFRTLPRMCSRELAG